MAGLGLVEGGASRAPGRTELPMYYQTLIKKLAPDLNPAGVEASMRLQYGILNHLPRETFVEEVRLAGDLERQSPGILRSIADSMGMADEFAKWEV